MLGTFALFIFCGAVLFIFAHEIGEGVKRLSKIPGVVLVVPLVLASFAVESLTPYINFVLMRLQRIIAMMTEMLMALIPSAVSSVFYAKMLLALLPPLFAFFIYPLLSRRRRRIGYYRINLLAFTALWLFWLVMLVTM